MPVPAVPAEKEAVAPSGTRAPHVPVLLAEVLEGLALPEGGRVLDVTAGAGGHLRAFCEAVGPTGRVIGLDHDARAHRADAAGGVVAAFADRAVLLRHSFGDIATVATAEGLHGTLDGLFADLGVSSMQLDEAERGFSFLRDGPFDMRMNDALELTARDLVYQLAEEELANIIYRYGEERLSRRIAKALKRSPLPSTTIEAADRVAQAMGGRRGKTHPATRTFQALRIAVNGELDSLDALLTTLPALLKPGGRAGILSFHSLEDRAIKHAFASGAGRTDRTVTPVYRLVTKKPLVAAPTEARLNPRARSAKLRVVERLP